MRTTDKRDDSLVRELVPTRVRFVVQARRPQSNGRDTSYSQVAGHALVVKVRNLREFRRLWRALAEVIEGGGWCDHSEPPADRDLPVAGVPLGTDQ
jgi:hypothetical protein